MEWPDASFFAFKFGGEFVQMIGETIYTYVYYIYTYYTLYWALGNWVTWDTC